MTTTAAAPAIVSARIPVTFTLLAPLHHGAGTSGNTQLLRVQEITQPDGTPAVVPFVSGNSLRHAIRAAAAEQLLKVSGVRPGSLSKPVVDLLYTGGALTSAGSDMDLATHRELDKLWPVAGLLGYAGRSNIWSGTLYTDHIHLVCSENVWRLPERLKTHPHARVSAAAMRDEDFGTRHDVTGAGGGRWIDTDVWTGESTQMIFDWQVVRAGATMHTTLHLAAATAGHVAALVATWQAMTAGGTMHLAAKRAQGYGLVRADIDWSVIPPVDVETYTAGLGQEWERILRLLETVA